MIYYTRTLKTGERYVTSYKDQAMAKRVAGMEKASEKRSMWNGELFFNLDTGEYGNTAEGVGLVSHISGAKNASSGGRFAVFSLLDGRPNDLGLRFEQYGDANKFLRAVAPAYGELFVLEMEKVGGGKPMESWDEEIEISDAPPF